MGALGEEAAVEELAELPQVVWWIIGFSILGMVAALIDLAFHEVRQLPRGAWAAIIVLISFPIGAVLYLTLGRVPGPRGSSEAPPSETSPTAASTARAGQLELRPGVDSVDERTAIVATDGLSKRYGETWALRDVGLRVPAGSTYGLIGPNGAGKTTLLSILAGLRAPTDGTLHLGVPRREVGVVVDTPQFEPWLTAREVVDLARSLTAPDQPADRVDEVLHEVGLEASATRRVGGFSRGMLQRVGLASGLVGRPQVLILDEPSSALDPAGRREVLDLIGALAGGTTVILSTHVLADVQQVCDVVGVIDDGELRFQGPLSELLARTSTVFALQVRGEASALRAELEARAWCQELTQPAPTRMRLVVTDASAAEREIPTLVAAHDLALASFTPATDLETAFLELTS